MDEGFKFTLGEPVMIIPSQERGIVIGRADYSEQQRIYLVRYQNANGCAVETWWSGQALSAIHT